MANRDSFPEKIEPLGVVVRVVVGLGRAEWKGNRIKNHTPADS